MNTDTPRTDKFTSTWDFHDEPFEAAEHARTLERELTAAREELSEWSILNGWGGTPEIINDFIKGQQTRIHYAQNLDEELTAVTEQRDRLAEAMRQMRSSGDIVICSQSATNLTTNENETRPSQPSAALQEPP
jgi:hypothetical protein